YRMRAGEGGAAILPCGCAPSLLPEITDYEPDVLLALAEAPGEVRYPLGTKRNIDAHIVALACDLFLRIRADPVEHLKFEPVAPDSVLGGEGFRCVDQPVVVRGDGR